MKVSQMFPRRYVTGADLGGKAHTLTIASVRTETMRPSPNARPEQKHVLYFVGAQKGLVLNRTNAWTLVDILGSEDTDDWMDGQVTIFPVQMTVAGKARIAIRVRPPDNGPTDLPPALQEEED